MTISFLVVGLFEKDFLGAVYLQLSESRRKKGVRVVRQTVSFEARVGCQPCSGV